MDQESCPGLRLQACGSFRAPLFILFSLFFFSTLESSVDDRAVEDLVRSHAEAYMQDKKLAGFAIGLHVDGRNFIFSYGVADRETQVPVDENTLFEIGSVTKVFTGADLALQVVRGRMQLKDPLDKYMPALRGGGAIRNVNLAELATHTASLPRVPPKPKGGPYTKEGIIHFLQEWRPSAPIGKHYLYSNLGFGLLGFALENLEKKPYQALLESDILRPLDMRSTFVQIPPEMKRHQAAGYSQQGARAAPWDVVWKGAGALRSSPQDMLKFIEGNLGIRGPSELREAMQEAQKEQFRVSDSFSLGLGWQRVQDRGVLIIDKNGAVPGFSTYIGMVPDRHLGIAIFSNQRHQGSTLLGRTLLLQIIHILNSR